MSARRLRPHCAWACAVIAALSGLLAAGVAHAQTTGSVEGLIQDTAGGALPSANVLVSGPSLQGVRTVKSGRDGRFWMPALPPGSYSVTVALAGFRPVTKAATVSLAAKTSIDFALEPAVSEAVSVSGTPQTVDLSSTTGGTNYTADVIARLPVDRNYADIVRSNPAVDTDRGDTQGRALALTIYGATSAENLWIVDGVNTTNAFVGMQGKAINNEFIQEVEVKTDGYGAEYGRALGGVINVITKSGGNAFHGDAFFYYDASAVSAEQVVTPEDQLQGESRMADYRRLDFGADLGGYVLKDRLWFFGAYDRIDFSGEVSPLADTPFVTTEERFPVDETDNLYSAKLTWNVAPTTTLTGTVFGDPSTASGAAGADPRQGPSGRVIGSPAILNRYPSTWYSARDLGGIDYGFRATHLAGSTGLLSLQAGFHQDRNLLTAPEAVRIEDYTCEDGAPGSPCPRPSVPNFVTGGYGWLDGQKDHNLSDRAQYRADFTFYAGNHELKTGADYQDAQSDMTYSVSGEQFVEVFNEYGTTYYRHTFSAVSGEDLTRLSGGRFRARLREVGAFVQDSWRAAPNLTINAGLRWDGETLQDYRGDTRITLNNQWQPRLGVVWDPWSDGRTKVYASAGRFYFAMPTAAMTWWFSDVTGVYVYNFDPASLEPDPNAARVSQDFDVRPPEDAEQGYSAWFGGGPMGTPTDYRLQEMYQDEFTIGIERALDPTFTLGLKASYRRLGNAIEDRCDFVDADGIFYCAIINPGSGERYASGDTPTFDASGTGPASPPARRLYRGIELVSRKSFGTRAWLQASYVHSSLEGNYDGAINEENAGPVPGRNIDFDFPELWYNAYGRLFLDRPNRFRFDGFGTGPWGLTLGLQFFVASGAPLNRLGYFAPYQSSMIYLDPRGSAGRLPTLWDATLSLSCPFTVGPTTVTLLAYVFNVFDNQIPLTRENAWTTGPDPDAVNPDYGKFTSRQAPRFFRAAVRVSF